MRAILFGLLLISGTASAAELSPIETSLRDCVRKAMSRKALDVCNQAALDSWQAELNALQLRVVEQLPPDERDLFERTSGQWEKYRDATFADLAKVGAGGWVSDPHRWAIRHEVLKGRIAVVDAHRRLLEVRI